MDWFTGLNKCNSDLPGSNFDNIGKLQKRDVAGASPFFDYTIACPRVNEGQLPDFVYTRVDFRGDGGVVIDWD